LGVVRITEKGDSMNDNAKIGLAVAGGYILGRTKKGKAALTAGILLAANRLGIQPEQLARAGLRRLAATPQIAALETQLRGPVLEAGRKAALATLESRMGRLADNLHARTASLSGATDDAKPTDTKASTNRSKSTGNADGGTGSARKSSTRKTAARRSTRKGSTKARGTS
jgi:hypothetical protein